jgi:hypothetical protein
MKPVLVLLAAAAVMPNLSQLEEMNARFAPVKPKYGESSLSAGDRKALPKLLDAARVLNYVYMDQLWSGTRALYSKLQEDKTPLGQARARYFWLNKGPWADLDGHTAFIPGVPERKPLGANFYPDDMTRDEFEAWAKTLSPADRQQAEGFFTVIRRDASHRLTFVPYSKACAADLQKAAGLLREAAALTDTAGLSLGIAPAGEMWSASPLLELSGVALGGCLANAGVAAAERPEFRSDVAAQTLCEENGEISRAVNDTDHLDRPRFPDIGDYVRIEIPKAIFPAEKIVMVVADSGRQRQGPEAFIEFMP